MSTCARVITAGKINDPDDRPTRAGTFGPRGATDGQLISEGLCAAAQARYTVREIRA
jgi:hypothetical protein